MKINDTKLISAIKTVFLYSVRFILPHLPLTIIYFIGNFLGSVMLGQKAQVIKDDLKALIGNMSEFELDTILRNTMQNFRKDLLEIWTFPKLNQNRINRM